ncbi:MAG TPA: ATP-dependent RNA helicase HrpA, partial [Phycisphaerales bacterium]|nr:ATP-dependent RNA helicase HrpA [Phycisphaerales bacterium]
MGCRASPRTLRPCGRSDLRAIPPRLHGRFGFSCRQCHTGSTIADRRICLSLCVSDGADNPKRKRRRRRRNFGKSPDKGHDQLDLCFGPDRARLRKALRTTSPEEAAALIRASRQRVAERAERLPTPTYPASLPFTENIDEIRETILANRVTIICGETGSGKSTQLPKLCLEMGRGTLGLIGHTQPRRLAARSVADRVAEELGFNLGNEIGYKVRFGDHTSPRTLVKLMTDGILLAETRSDRLLEHYDTLIIDEAHERSLNIDFILGILTQILPKRPDLKLIITSATIDAERFADHFTQAIGQTVPVLEISGRTHPVEIVYKPITADRDDPEQTIPEAIAEAVEHLADFDPPGDPGGILVFLPGEREIREAAHELRRRFETDPSHRHTEVLPLYARLSPADQHRIFSVRRGRRIVLATNVAETSLTVPGIRHVVDTGVARINRYSSRRKIQSLQIEPISRASARQRAGRCGRTEPGICIRLYSQADHDAREEFTPPEIVRTNLAGVILQMRSLRLGDPETFPFLESPDRRRIHDAYDTLIELNAMDHNRTLTKIGKQLARLPVDPRIGRILVAAAEEGVLSEGLVIASFLEIRDPRDRPADKRDAADAKHARWNDATSDFIGILNLWDFYHTQKDKLSRSQLRRDCKSNFLSYQRMREWTDTHRQLRDLCKQVGLRFQSTRDGHDAIHRAIITGCLTNIGKRHPDGGFSAPRGGLFQIHPSSAVAVKGTKWVVAAELVRTTRLFARTVARVNPRWIIEAAEHLIKREYTDPAFVPERGRVEVSMTATLWDLEIIKESRVDLSPIDRQLARRVFIEQALVERGYTSGAKFEEHNDALIEQIHRREAKLRQARVPIAACLQRFFDERLPPDICTVRGFDRWRRREEQRNRSLLHLTPGDFGLESLDDLNPEHY